MNDQHIIENAPENVKKYIENHPYHKDNIGMESSFVFVYNDLNLVLKVVDNEVHFQSEMTMMKWLNGKVLVPRIIEYGMNEGYYYLLMTKLEGLMSFDDKLMKNPEELIDILVSGIKSFWDIPITNCPINNRNENKLRIAKQRIDKNLVDVEDFDEELTSKRFKSAEEIYQYLVENKIEEKLVVSHGDYCLPNIFIIDQKISGFIDLSRAGIADIYQDISLLIRSFNYNNKSDDYKKLIIEKLGIEFDEKKYDYYLLLDELF